MQAILDMSDCAEVEAEKVGEEIPEIIVRFGNRSAMGMLLTQMELTMPIEQARDLHHTLAEAIEAA